MSLAFAPTLAPSYDHLWHLTDGVGLFEHARHGEPRIEHGYCTDDVARALVVVLREPDPDHRFEVMTEIYLRFLESAVITDGRVHNRMSGDGRWVDEGSIGDWWGRAVGALGMAACHAREPWLRTRAMYAFLRAAAQSSPDTRASSFAALGAAEVLRSHPDSDRARKLLVHAIAVIPTAPTAVWAWPEARLRYANAALPHALIVAGDALGDPGVAANGLRMLATLLDLETNDSGRLSVTGSRGRGPGDAGPLWDQQGIETAALADACAAAYRVTGDGTWLAELDRTWAWFLGANDSGTPMYDAVTGAGYDGLEPYGRNDNRGAESTLAALSTLQLVRALSVVRA